MKIEEAYFNLITETVRHCFTAINSGDNKKNVINGRLKFADSTLLKIYCDCSNIFTFKEISKLIKLFNNNESKFNEYIYGKRNFVKKDIIDELKKRYESKNLENIQGTKTIEKRPK